MVDLGSVQNYVITDTSDYSTVIGSFGYMAPEQTIGKTIPSSDLYSLGMTIVFLITGKHPGLIEQIDLKPNYKNASISNNNLEILIDLLIEPDFKKRIQTAQEALNILNETKYSIANENSNLKAISTIYQKFLANNSKILLSYTNEGIFIKLPKKFGRNLQGSFGNTVLLLDTEKVLLFRSLGTLWEKQIKIGINKIITCSIKKRRKYSEKKNKNKVTYLSLETLKRNYNFAHNLTIQDKESISKIINDFIMKFKRKDKTNKNPRIDLISSAVKGVRNFIKKIIKDLKEV